MIALQVVRTSFGFHLRECMGSCFAPPVHTLFCSNIKGKGDKTALLVILFNGIFCFTFQFRLQCDYCMKPGSTRQSKPITGPNGNNRFQHFLCSDQAVFSFLLVNPFQQIRDFSERPLGCFSLATES